MRTRDWIATEEQHQALATARRPAPPPPEWLIEHGIGTGRPPVRVHAGGCWDTRNPPPPTRRGGRWPRVSPRARTADPTPPSVCWAAGGASEVVVGRGVAPCRRDCGWLFQPYAGRPGSTSSMRATSEQGCSART
ncbi:DUF6233 domain-containing protein [Streptomyces lavendulae]|uniref:DUF6233 domain-containing protein n=1 Tax=Streptomyces lavendulae TaxID=1914 RepID=UPI0036C15907